MSRLDYSKWDHIEISDDEDDTHPNIDTPSLFRWRHQARLERMEQAEKEKQSLQSTVQSHQQKMAEIKQKIKEAEEKNLSDELEKLKTSEAELLKQDQEFAKKEEELKKKERLTPWNVDTICHDGKSKTIINKDIKPSDEELSDEQRADRQKEHEAKYKSHIRKFGMMRRYEDSEKYLKENIDLVCEETANYLVLWCIDLECQEKKELMKHVSHQTIVMQFILELAKQLKVDPKSCVNAFFSRIRLAEKQYMDAFNDELESFRSRVKERARIRIEEAMKEVEEEERQKRLGPGGLDPVEVFETLPKSLQECFEQKDIPLLKKVISEMDPKEAEEHMKRCVDSGLWVPGGNDEPDQEIEPDGEAIAEPEENDYEEPTKA
ncbi:DgyrCDS6687 [Dimorphilus gyrociliatus]|uniref:Hsp90 chaperone protein kinase-targeting subunit n=1 Tax=Dimorphilus gyrociliatus TaxID=2664684 RepID=A0A7I8VQB8_9ANNE|nr:DgyrCDS6687 [Dimorphilus gyrociliatus]